MQQCKQLWAHHHFAFFYLFYLNDIFSAHIEGKSSHVDVVEHGSRALGRSWRRRQMSNISQPSSLTYWSTILFCTVLKVKKTKVVAVVVLFPKRHLEPQQGLRKLLTGFDAALRGRPPVRRLRAALSKIPRPPWMNFFSSAGKYLDVSANTDGSQWATK